MMDDIPPPPTVAPPTTRKGNVTRNIGLAMAIRIGLAVVLVGGGAIWGFLTNAKRDSSGQITDAGNIQAEQMSVGDCVNWPDAGNENEVFEFESVKALPCNEPHDLEVYASLIYPAQSPEYPGDESIGIWADNACFEAFEPYVGRTYEEATELGYTYFWPTETSWRENDDRTVTCVVGNSNETQLSGSVRGT